MAAKEWRRRDETTARDTSTAAPDANGVPAHGVFWMTLWLVFEWGGSLIIGRPVQEILVGWHVEHGYMWPYVLVAYLLAPLLAGAGRCRSACAPRSGASGQSATA